jgi:hypothetical protein
MRVFIGLDVSFAKTAICVVDRDGALQWQGKVAGEPGPLISRLARWSGVIERVGIEVCPLSEWLHRGLRAADIPSSASRHDTLSASCPRDRLRLTRTTLGASPR